MTASTRERSTLGVAAASLFTVAVLVHNFDHLRRGIEAVHRDVFWAGTMSIGLEVAIVVLLVARHRFAPLVSVVGGFGLALGYLTVHFLPARAWLSDSFTSHAGYSSTPKSGRQLTLSISSIASYVRLS